jgi:ABC-type Fe3+-hydroxamate transport system substrate-binding protein
MKTLIDQLGTAHTLKLRLSIISLVPSQTELLIYLGEDKIIGITKFCVHPYHFRSTKSVLAVPKVHYEKIRLLKPDIIICIRKKILKKLLKD